MNINWPVLSVVTFLPLLGALLVMLLARGNGPPLPVAEPSTFVRVERKVGRNEPCPCGSGKKYKHCHGVLSSVQ